ncbi:MAG TPA: ABC transporter substrate-binding protein [Thermoflexales bacterium]|nr:ABC transporter substrate-binding protein [Thermoflexales bacterium]
MRIVSLLPAATDILVALGLGDALVGHSHLCDAPEGGEVVTAAQPPGAAEHSAWRVDWDAVATLQPDLILTRAMSGHAPIAGALVGIDLPVGGTAFGLEATGLDGMLESIQAIAGECGAREAGQRVAEDLRGRIDEMAERSAMTRHKPVVVALEDFATPMAAGLWVPEQVRLAGGTATLVDEGGPSAVVTWEDVASVQPELFLAMPRAGDVLASLQALMALGARDDLRWMWRDIPAAYLSQIYALDARLFSGPSPRLVDGIAVLAGLLHPDVFPAPLAAYALRP